LAFSFLLSLISGILLYFTPQGKIAHWTNWTILGLDKEMWAALHINSSLIFFVIFIFHLYFNWRVLVRYVKKRAEMAFNLKYEFVFASIISIFIVVATLFNIEPFKTVIKWNDDIKNYWASQAQAQPPIPHAEDMNVTDFCKNFNISYEFFEQKMNQKNRIFKNKNETIKDIAHRNKISPADIYRFLTPSMYNKQDWGTNQAQGQPGVHLQIQGQGWGRKTLQDVCKTINIDMDKAINILSRNGIKASKNELVRNIATNYNLRPIDIINMMQNPGKGNGLK
jgi:hypothetical protein